MTDPDIERVLRWLMAQDPPVHLGFHESRDVEELGLTDEAVDDIMREGLDRGLLRGDRTDYGSMQRWERVQITALGLRFCREWPPAGREHQPGPWDAGRWGVEAKPFLERVRDGAYPDAFLHSLWAGAPPSEWHERLAANELLAAGYLSGRPQRYWGISEMRLTAAGREALDSTPRNPLDEARRKLRTSPVEGAIHAVEIALGERLRELARAMGDEDLDPDAGRRLARLNDGLTGKNGPQVYGKPWKKVIDGVLDVRNEYAHGRGDQLPLEVAEWVIDTVDVLLRALPKHSPTPA